MAAAEQGAQQIIRPGADQRRGVGDEEEQLHEKIDYINDLLEFQSVSFAAYEENKVMRRAVERTLHSAI
jgi:hypothetical protein